MSSLKFVRAAHWDAIEDHLRRSGRGERFAFAHVNVLAKLDSGPVLEVINVDLIPDEDVERDATGWCLTDAALDRVHNGAVTGGYGLIEFHNHRIGPPGFSPTDEAGLDPMADYVTGLCPDRPYGAAVVAQGRVHAEHWTRTELGMRRGQFRSVVVIGNQLRMLNATTDHNERLDRQADLLGETGAATLAELRVAVVGAGGTGSHAALALAYLGVRELLVLDDDHVELTNLNRLVTASHADVGAPKNLVTRRRTREIDPNLSVHALPGLTPDGEHPELHDVDLIFGCVDHDGPRDRLNQIAVVTATPLIDIATGIDVSTTPLTAGGRVVLVSPGGPCLQCLGELDSSEVGRWTKEPAQQAIDRAHGYGARGGVPSVVHLNGLAVYAAIAELVAWISGQRPPAQYLDIDVSGHLTATNTPSGSRVAPRRPARRAAHCFACAERELHVARDISAVGE